MLLAKLRPLAGPWLQQRGLAWEDICPALGLADSVEELQQAVAEPEKFLEKITSEAGGPVGKKLLLPKLRPLAEPLLQQHGLAWEAICPALRLVDSVEELQQAVQRAEALPREWVAPAAVDPALTDAPPCFVGPRRPALSAAEEEVVAAATAAWARSQKGGLEEWLRDRRGAALPQTQQRLTTGATVKVGGTLSGGIKHEVAERKWKSLTERC